jgi:prepilin-type N-terminal cleavage/methylation domain-containing protein
MKKITQKVNKGFTLIEMMVSVVIFTLSVLAMMVILGGGISDTNLAKNKVVASYLAQEGIEYVRSLRDTYAIYGAQTGWGDFLTALNKCSDVSSGNKGCYFDVDNMQVGGSVTDPDMMQIIPCFDGNCEELRLNSVSGLYSYNTGDPSGFYRRFYVVGSDFDGLKDKEIILISSVYWEQNGKVHEVVFREVFLNWIRHL